jgi:hypothetical protein
MHEFKYSKTDYKTHFIESSTSYTSWHQGAIIREFISIKFCRSNSISGAKHPHSITRVKSLKILKLQITQQQIHEHIPAVTEEPHRCVVVVLQQCVHIPVGV